MPLEGPDLFPRGHFPHLDRGILAAGGQALAIGAKRHAPYGAGVSFESEEFLAGSRVPYPPRTVRNARSQPFAIRTESDACDRPKASLDGAHFDGAHFLPGGRIPYLHRVAAA